MTILTPEKLLLMWNPDVPFRGLRVATTLGSFNVTGRRGELVEQRKVCSGDSTKRPM